MPSAHLASLGHERIAVGTAASEINYSHVFAEAFCDALQRDGLPVDPDLVLLVENSDDGGYELGNRIFAMRRPPTAVVLVNEFMAIGLYRSMQEQGLTPGRDLAIVGFQEEPNSRLLTPRVTCFRTALPALGARLGEALLATIPAHAPAGERRHDHPGAVADGIRAGRERRAAAVIFPHRKYSFPSLTSARRPRT